MRQLLLAVAGIAAAPALAFLVHVELEMPATTKV